MAFKRKVDKGSGEQYKFESVGQSLTGYYLGSVEHEGDYGPTYKHLFKTAKGIKVVFGQTHLTSLLMDETDPVPVGSLVRVTYDSSKKLKKGNPMKVYTVDIDSDDVLDSAEIPATVEAATEAPDMDEEDDEPTEDAEDTAADEVKTTPIRTAKGTSPSAASQARVKELLSRNKAS